MTTLWQRTRDRARARRNCEAQARALRDALSPSERRDLEVLFRLEDADIGA